MEMTTFETQKDIREEVVALIASHTGITPHSIDRDSPIWVHFPRNTNKQEHPTVTSFVQDVHSEFNVYLTEDEWEQPTPNTLAEDIRAKRAEPAASVADWTKDRADLKSGTMVFAVFVLALIPAVFFLGSGSRTTRVVVGFLLSVFFAVLLLVGYRRKIRALDASAPRR
jgi:hypothetical protein